MVGTFNSLVLVAPSVARFSSEMTKVTTPYLEAENTSVRSM